MSRNLEDISCKSAVAQFYDNRAIFITGATGFMGKVTWGLDFKGTGTWEAFFPFYLLLQIKVLEAYSYCDQKRDAFLAVQ